MDAMISEMLRSIKHNKHLVYIQDTVGIFV